ncbi:MAG: DUF4856 domain-containing protein [Saprospiraceae bacterium]
MKPLLTLLLLTSFFFISCGDDDPVTPTLEVPTTYTFDNVSYGGQLSRLAQLGELKSYMVTAQSGEALDADRLKAMYANEEGADFSRSYEKDIRSKTFEIVRENFDTYLELLAQNSTSTTPASSGVAGISTSPDGEKNYVLNENGVEYIQIIEKGLMGACFYYQGTSVYLGEDRMNVDNETVEPGEGTAMEHHWDEAFGYFGVATDFPSNTDGVVFWGDYCNDRDADLQTNSVMDAFLTGRAAISAKNLTVRDEQITTVREKWELVSAATAIHYLNGGLANPDDQARRLHAISEAIAFGWSLQFNEATRISRTEVNSWLEGFAGSSVITEMNLYNTTDAQLEEARRVLVEAYGLESSAATL